MQEVVKEAVRAELAKLDFREVLDAPSGNGWLIDVVRARPAAAVDGVDLYASPPDGYRRFWSFDLDDGLPPQCTGYDLVCCCEGLEHVGNPLLLMRRFFDCLVPGGTLLVTTPNTWYPQARIRYLFSGFFPAFPALPGKVARGTHMHIMPWAYPQLYVFLCLAGFDAPRILPERLTKAPHPQERLVGLFARAHCRRKLRAAASDEERGFWAATLTQASLMGRQIIVTARKPHDAG